MKKFKVYSILTEYIVLKCPHCGREFRSIPQSKVFGKERKNAKCQRCERNFDFVENQLDEDPLPKLWDSDRPMIMIKPDGTQEFFERDEPDVPDLKKGNKFN